MSNSVKTKTMPDELRVSADLTVHRKAHRLLGRSFAFGICASEVLDELLALGRPRELVRGEYLCRINTPVTRVSMLVEGAMEIARIQPDGHRHLVGLALPGDFMSLAGMIDGQGHLHDVSARTDAWVLEFNVERLTQLREKHPSLVRACERLLVRRLRLAHDRLAADPALPLETRVAHTLCMCQALFGAGTARDGKTHELELSQSDLADWLGISRQRINFALKRLESDGWISLRYSRLSIHDLAALQRMARQ